MPIFFENISWKIITEILIKYYLLEVFDSFLFYWKFSFLIQKILSVKVLKNFTEADGTQMPYF